MRFAPAEDDLVLRIPMILRVRPVVVQPRAVLIAVHVEDVRVAIRVGIVRRAVRATTP